jgi:hypothetical protein
VLRSFIKVETQGTIVVVLSIPFDQVVGSKHLIQHANKLHFGSAFAVQISHAAK